MWGKKEIKEGFFKKESRRGREGRKVEKRCLLWKVIKNNNLCSCFFVQNCCYLSGGSQPINRAKLSIFFVLQLIDLLSPVVAFEGTVWLVICLQMAQ
jgi:hypothetical protein